MAGTNNLEVNTPAEIARGVAALCDEIELPGDGHALE